MEIDYSLYLCTDRNLTENLEKAVELAIKGGVKVVQLREKNCDGKNFFEVGQKIKKITEKNKIPLIVNDRVDIAMAIDAEGVHVGQNDLPCKVVRKILGEKKIIGVSCSTIEQAIQAENDGANYIGVGAIFETSTKTDAKIVSIETLKKIREKIKIPIVAIGGINKKNLPQIKNFIDGAAVVSAIISAKNPELAAKELLQILKGEKFL